MKIAGLAVALLLSSTAFGAQTGNRPLPSRLAWFLTAKKNAVVSKSVGGRLSARIGRGWPPGEGNMSHAVFVAIVARAPGSRSDKAGGMKIHIELRGKSSGSKLDEDTIYLDGDKLADFEKSLERLVNEQPRNPENLRPGGDKIRFWLVPAFNDTDHAVAGRDYTAPLSAGWCAGPGGYGLVIDSLQDHRTYYFPGIPLARFVGIIAAARAYIHAN
jgi:hypothetical protein